MSGGPFKLGTFASAGRRFAGLVMGDRVIDLAAIHPHFAKSNGAQSGVLSDPGSVLGLLQDWDRNFPTLQAIAAFIAREGYDDEPVKSAAHALKRTARAAADHSAAQAALRRRQLSRARRGDAQDVPQRPAGDRTFQGLSAR
jgi:hypothetical protein